MKAQEIPVRRLPSDLDVTSHPDQLSLAIPSWVAAMSTSNSWDVSSHTARCTSLVSVVSQCQLVSGWGLRKQRSAPPAGPYGWARTLRTFKLKKLKASFSCCCLSRCLWREIVANHDDNDDTVCVQSVCVLCDLKQFAWLVECLQAALRQESFEMMIQSLTERLKDVSTIRIYWKLLES